MNNYFHMFGEAWEGAQHFSQQDVSHSWSGSSNLLKTMGVRSRASRLGVSGHYHGHVLPLFAHHWRNQKLRDCREECDILSLPAQTWKCFNECMNPMAVYNRSQILDSSIGGTQLVYGGRTQHCTDLCSDHLAPVRIQQWITALSQTSWSSRRADSFAYGVSEQHQNIHIQMDTHLNIPVTSYQSHTLSWA